ncbi:heparan-alpha-glucosaminide N-acetyltransferase domain-containing protein [Amycolatopsis lurida]|uniref:heparan-alpha-glucosaminide N-acetyltransferase domain-containing protein n=1 Tax=Amycolatopsis lurida TaxID=31959 RepID=UPI003659C057
MDGVTVMDRALVDGARTVPEQGKRVAGRLTGIDVARGLAVLGMYAVHVGPDPAKGGVGVLFKPFEGHSAALFAVLAGVSIALMSGGRRPKQGRDRTRVALKLATRAPLLVALGLWLTSLETGYMVILAYYGACFLFAIPWLRAGAKALAIAAVVVAVAGPLLSHLIRAQLLPRDLLFFAPDLTADDVTSTGLLKAATVLVLTGTFPALTLMAYVFAGMAIGRMDLTSRSVCRRLFFGGSALAVGGYVVSWIATGPLGGMQAVYRSLEPAAAQMGMTPPEFLRLHQTWIHGTPPTTSWAWELLPTGTSYTPFDLLISIGIAAAVIGGCQLLMPRFERVLRPLSDLGGRVLSAYVLHFVAIALLWDESDGDSIFSVLHFVEFSVVALTAAVLWRKFIGRGPLEWAMNKLSSWPKYLVPRTRVPAQRRG